MFTKARKYPGTQSSNQSTTISPCDRRKSEKACIPDEAKVLIKQRDHIRLIEPTGPNITALNKNIAKYPMLIRRKLGANSGLRVAIEPTSANFGN